MYQGCLLTGLIYCVLSSQASAQEFITLKDGQEDLVINPYVYILKEETVGLEGIDRVVTAPDSAFERNTYFQEVHYGLSRPSGWCRFTITNTSGHTDWILKIHQSRVDTVLLYVQKASGDLIPFPMTGHFQPIREREVFSLSFGYPLDIGTGETIECYLYTMRKFARHAAVLNLQTADHYLNYDKLLTILISALMGICLLASVIGLVMFAVLRERVYISYSIYCICFLLLIAIDAGFVYAFIQLPEHQKLVNNLSIIVYYLIAGWHILFTVELLRLKSYPRQWVFWLGIGSGLLFCSAAVFLLLPVSDIVRQYLSTWSYYILFFIDAYIMYAMIIQLIRKEVIVYFYMAGFLFTLIAASVAMLADLQLIEGINQRTDILFIAPVVEIVCMVIGLGINSNRFVKDRLKAQRQIITVQEEERERIARDLHDQVGNSLVAVRTLLTQKPDLQVIDKEIGDIIRDIRNISHDLMPVDFSEYALTEIIRETVNKFKGHPDIHFDFNHSGETEKLHPVAELVIYRIINELITNSIKHSQASRVMIQLIYQKKSLVVMVEDNGIGLKSDLYTETGIGLKNIRHRVAYIEASLAIESDKKGTLFIIEIPYDRQQ